MTLKERREPEAGLVDLPAVDQHGSRDDNASPASLVTAGGGRYWVVCPYPHLAGAGCHNPRYRLARHPRPSREICDRALSTLNKLCEAYTGSPGGLPGYRASPPDRRPSRQHGDRREVRRLGTSDARFLPQDSRMNIRVRQAGPEPGLSGRLRATTWPRSPFTRGSARGPGARGLPRRAPGPGASACASGRRRNRPVCRCCR